MLDRPNLHTYQKGAIAHLTTQPQCGLLMEMGLGKTVCCLTAIVDLKNRLDIGKVLVVGPPRVAEHVWAKEVSEWAHLSHLRVLPVFGSPLQRKSLLRRDADIYTLSVGNLGWFCAEYPRHDFDMLIVDESSMFKSHNTNRFNDIKTILDTFERRVILTGTPTPNSLIELWPQLFILDKGERLGKYITHYRRRFFAKGFHQFSKFRPVEGAQEKIEELVGDICISMRSEDYLDLPERISHTIKVPFTPKLKEEYERFERDYILELVDEHGSLSEIPAMNAAALMNKLLQFANGAVYDGDKMVRRIHDLKMDELEERVAALNGEPVFIAWAYQHDRDRMLTRLKKYGVKQFSGSKDIDLWNAGKIPVLISHPASAAHGLNMQHGGHHIIWYGQTWSLEQYQQFNARLHRQGQRNRTFIHHLVMEGSVDERVLDSLQGKRATQDAIMDALKYRAAVHNIH